jgi:hypothetical protein
MPHLSEVDIQNSGLTKEKQGLQLSEKLGKLSPFFERVIRVPDYIPRYVGFDSQHILIFWEVVVLERTASVV